MDAGVCLDTRGRDAGALGGFARRRTGSDADKICSGWLRGSGGHVIVPAGAAVPFGCACVFFGGSALRFPLSAFRFPGSLYFIEQRREPATLFDAIIVASPSHFFAGKGQ